MGLPVTQTTVCTTTLFCCLPGIEQLLDMFNSNKTKEIAPEVLAMYPESEFPENGWGRLSAILTDFMFGCSTRRAARAIATHGAPIWLYDVGQGGGRHFAASLASWCIRCRGVTTLL